MRQSQRCSPIRGQGTQSSLLEGTNIKVTFQKTIRDWKCWQPFLESAVSHTRRCCAHWIAALSRSSITFPLCVQSNRRPLWTLLRMEFFLREASVLTSSGFFEYRHLEWLLLSSVIATQMRGSLNLWAVLAENTRQERLSCRPQTQSHLQALWDSIASLSSVPFGYHIYTLVLGCAHV